MIFVQIYIQQLFFLKINQCHTVFNEKWYFKPPKTQLIESAPEIDIRSRNRHRFCQAPHHEIDQINPDGPRKGHTSHRTTHCAWVRGCIKHINETKCPFEICLNRLNHTIFRQFSRTQKNQTFYRTL